MQYQLTGHEKRFRQNRSPNTTHSRILDRLKKREYRNKTVLLLCSQNINKTYRFCTNVYRIPYGLQRQPDAVQVYVFCGDKIENVKPFAGIPLYQYADFGIQKIIILETRNAYPV